MDLDKHSEISIDINKNLEKHNGKSITLVSVSPNGTYVVTYSREDNSIVGWTIDDDEVSKWIPLNSSDKVTVHTINYIIEEIKVNNNKIVLYGNRHCLKGIIEMQNDRHIKLKLDSPLDRYNRYYFNKDDNLVISKGNEFKREVLVYSLQRNELISSYNIYKSYKSVVKITDDNNGYINDNILWTMSSNNLFQWKLKPLELEFSYSLGFDRINEVKVRKDLIVIKCEKGIEIYSKGVLLRYIQTEYPTSKIELLCGRYLLVIMEEKGKQHIRLYDLTDINNKRPVDAIKIFKDEKSESNIFLCEYSTESKKAFGLVNGRISSMNLSNWNCHNCHEFFKLNHANDVDETTGWNAYLNEDLSDHDMDETLSNHVNDVETLFNHVNETPCNHVNDVGDDDYNIINPFSTDDVIYVKNFSTDDVTADDDDAIPDDVMKIDFENKQYKWRIHLDQKKLSVYDTSEVELDSKSLTSNYAPNYILNNDVLVLLYHNYMTIYKYDINNKNIIIQYYYSNNGKKLTAEELLSGPRLPINIYQGDKNSKIFDEWIKNLIEDNKSLEKYGQTLLSMLIKKKLTSSIESSIDKWVNFIEDHKYLEKYGQALLSLVIKKKLTNHVESIYSRCIRLVKEDPKRNLKYLNIITLSMKGLYKEYPDYITRFNSEMLIFLDPFHEKINKKYYHFFTFSQEIFVHKVSMFNSFQFILIYLFHLDNILDKLFKHFTSFLHNLSSQIITNQIAHDDGSQYIFLIVPYVSFSCYPLEYNGFKDFVFPQSSVFVDTCKKKEFYTNWNSEAIINFKWKKFGRYYYFGGWFIFTAFLICFTIASFPSDSITQEIRISLYQTSIVFGLLHLLFEFRQFIWNPIKYFFSIWNWFDLSAYLLATITSFYYGNTPYWALSFSCLLLDAKFLLFFKIFEIFGIYFAIMFGVAKRVLPFVIILGILVLSFAHSFFVLLHPQNFVDSLSTSNSNSNDLNNPWKLTNTYSQIDENGNINPNATLIQIPDENSNLFASYFTSILAMDRFLIGDQSPLSSRTPTIENTPVIILTFIFSFIVVIYMMNLFIGLLNMAIEEDNSRASYLSQKAEVLAEIELFYLLPFQRRWRAWFPEVIYYAVSVDKTRMYIKKAIDNGDWKKEDYDDKIIKLLHIEDAIEDYWV